jgi:eukaryotic-like serine/threonine-protein kinase
VFDTHKITRSITGHNQGQLDSSLKPGVTLQNRYLIQSVLGVGGMGSVYKARDMHFPNVTKLVAVKEIINLADPGMRELVIRTFEREANLLAELNHPSIPKIYDYFTQNDKSFLVQEYIDGKDLEAYVNDAPGLLSEEMVVEWAIQLCDVLSYLHKHQPEPIIFRDMKPSNVMLDHHNHIRLIDFGIARGFQSGQKGTMIGTEGYSPPEQYRGEASPAGDIYALGATLHHLLTKQDPRIEPPFSFSERPVRKINPSVTIELEAIINTALNYNPVERFPSAQAMKDALIMMRRARTGILPSQPLTMPSGIASGVVPGMGATPAAATPTKAILTGAVTPVWVFKCEDEIRGNPLVANGIVYVGVYDNNLYAVNAIEGKLLWKYATDGGLPGSPAIQQDLLLIGSEDKRLHAISAKSGRVQWTYYTDAPIRSSPRLAEGHIFIGSDDAHLHAVNLGTGRRVWRVKATDAIRCRPAVANDRIFFGCESGELLCVDFSGEVKWRQKAKRALTSSPLIHQGNLYLGSVDGQVYAHNATDGWPIWRFRTGKAIISSPAAEGNLLFIGSVDNHLYAIDIRNGREAWRFETGGQVTSSPAVNKGVVYVGSVDSHVYAVDISSGKLRWKFRAGGPITSSPMIVNDIVYIGSFDHNLYALTA